MSVIDEVLAANEIYSRTHELRKLTPRPERKLAVLTCMDTRLSIRTLGQDGELALGARSQFAQFMGARVDFVGGEDFVDDAHGQNSLAKPRRVSGERNQMTGSCRSKRKGRAPHVVPLCKELQLRFDGLS